MGNIFLKEFLKNRKQIGSIAPSSPLLAKKMLKAIDFKAAKVIVEYGPGTGVFTHRIAEKMHTDSKLFVFELDQVFYKKLKREFSNQPNVFIINDSALQVKEYLLKQKEELADIVISSLPLSNFKLRLARMIVGNAKEALHSKGKFVQYQYSLGARKMLERTFDEVSIQYVVGNIPPAFVYTCQKK